MKQSVEEYADSRSQAVGTLCLVIEAIGQYVVETDPASTERLRGSLGHIVEKLRGCLETPNQRVITETPATVGTQLRDYRDFASAYIEQFRTALRETGEALNEITQMLQADDSDAHRRLKTTIAGLEGLASLQSLVDVRAGLKLAVANLTECAEHVRREKDGLVIQLRDEIRTLQKSVQLVERAATMDPATGVYRREEFQKLILRDIVAERPIDIIHIWLRNLRELKSTHAAEVIDELLADFCIRVSNIVPAGAVVGRWSSDAFCVIVPSDMTRRTSSDLMRGCVGRYLCVSDGSAHTVNIDGTATCIKLQPHENAEIIFEKLDRIHFALPNSY